MAAPLTTSFRIGIFGTMRVTFDQNVNLAVDPTNKGTFVDAGGNEFNTANASITSGTTVEATIVAGGAVNPTSNGTCALASGFATLVLTPFTANAPTANNAFSYTGISSAAFNKSTNKLVITFVDLVGVAGDFSTITLRTSAGAQYAGSGIDGPASGTATIVVDMTPSTSSAAAGTMNFDGADLFERTSDGIPSIAISNFPITDASGGFRSRSRNFRGR